MGKELQGRALEMILQEFSTGGRSQHAGVETEQDPVGLLDMEAFLSPFSCS